MAERDGGRYLFTTGLNNNDLRAGAAQATNMLRGIGDRAVAEGTRIDNAFKKVATGLGSVFVFRHASQFVSQVARVRGEFQQLEVAFETMLQSKSKADALMSQLVHTAAITPFGLQDVAGGAKQLLAYGESAETVNNTLVRLGDIAAGLSIPLNDLVYLYGTTMVQGRLFTQDVRQFQGRGIPMVQELAKAMGKTTDEINGMVTAGKIGFPEVQKVINNLTSEGGTFFNLMEKQSKTITGQIANLGDAMDVMFNEIGQSSEGAISGAISGITSLVENYKEVGKTILELVAVYGAYKAALITLNAIQKWNIALTEAAAYARTMDLMAIRNGEVGVRLLTAAEYKNAAAKTILTGAYQRLTLAIKQSTAAMLKNPYVLIAAAVAALAYGVYKLVTAETEAEAAQREHNEAMEAAKERKENLISKTKELTNIINGETQTIYAQIKAWKELQKEMPEAFANMTMKEFQSMKPEEREKLINKTAEDRNTDGINKAYNDALEALNKRIEIYEKERYFSTDHELSLKRQIESAEKILELKKKEKEENDKIIRQAEFDAKPDSEKVVILEKQRQKLQNQLAELEKLIPESYRVADSLDNSLSPSISNVKKGLFDINTEWGKFDWQTQGHIAQFGFLSEKINGIIKMIKAINDANGNGLTYAEAKANAKKAYTEAKELVDKIKKDSQKYTKKQYTDAVEGLEEAQKAYKALGGDVTKPKASKIAEEKIAASERIKKIEEYKKAIAESVKDTEIEIRQAQIDAMDEGFEKQARQIDLNFDKLIYQNKQRKADMVKELNAMDEIVWQQENPKFKEKGNVYVDRKTEADIPEEQLVQLEAFTVLANTYKEKANKEMLKNMLDEFASYEQQVTETTKEYEDKRRQMHNSDGSLKEGFTAANEDELNRNKENALNAINLSFAERETSFKAWMDNIANMSLKQLEKVLKQAENELNNLESGGEKDDKKLALAKAKITEAKKKIEEENSISPGKRSIKEWGDLRKKLEDVNGKFEEIGDTVGGTAGEIIKTASNIAGGTIAMIDGIKVLAVGAGQAISAVEKASVILAIIGAAVQVITAIFNMASKAEAQHQAALEEIQNNRLAMQREYNLLLLEQNLLLKEAETIFGTNEYRRATNAVEVYKKSISDLNAEIYGMGKASRTISGINAIRIKTDHYKTGLFGWGKGRDIYSGILDVYPELIDKAGKLDAELAKIILPKITDDTEKASLQNMIDLAEEAEKAYKEVEDYLSGIFGELGNTMSDALTDAFRNGTDAAKAFSDSVSSMLEKLAQDMIYSVTLAPIFEQAQKEMLKTTENIDLTDEEKFKQYTQIMNGLVSDANLAKNTAMDMYKAFQDEAANQNVGLWKPDEREASSKGFTSMNQDSADELNGRFATFTTLAYSINENTKILVTNSNQVLKHLAGIESNTKYCENLSDINKNIASVKYGIDNINTKGITLKNP